MNISNKILLLRLYLLKQEINDAKKVHNLKKDLDLDSTYVAKRRALVFDDFNKNSYVHKDFYYNPKTKNALTVQFDVQAGHLKKAMARKLTKEEKVELLHKKNIS